MIDLRLLRPFLAKVAAEDTYPAAQQQAIGLQNLDAFEESQEDEKVLDPDLEKQNPEDINADQTDKIEDMLLNSGMRELSMPDQNDTSSFGKLAALLSKKSSAFVRDLPLKELEEGTKSDVTRFVGKQVSTREVIEYGMVVSELLPKVDPHNFKQAESNVKIELSKQKRQEALDEFFKKAKTKYLLLMNDKLIDGHHFLAKAKALNITCSLKVLDLTPIRFQEKKAASILEQLKEAKRKSDKKDYSGKYRILHQLIQKHRAEFVVDQDKPDYPGITHQPTGFRMHAPKSLASGLAKLRK